MRELVSTRTDYFSVPNMEYTKLGTTGLEVSRICLGMMSYGDSGWRGWVISEDAATPFIEKAADGGINFSIPPTFTRLVSARRSPGSS